MIYIKAMGFEVKCVPVLDRMMCCCCSCDLKVATCILGWLGLVADVGSFLRSAIGLAIFEDSKDVLPQDTQAALTVTLITAAISILLVALLLYGAHNERPGFMLPFVVLNMIGIVVFAVFVVVSSILLFISNFLVGFGILIVGGLFVALSSFFWMVIYSYYRKLEERRSPFPVTSLDNVFTGKTSDHAQ